MTNEERDLITKFIERVGGRVAASGGFAGSVPTTGTPLPPVDAEADRLLADLFTRYPEARYRITQLAFVQEHAVAAAANQISQLQSQISQLQQQMQSQMQQVPAAAASSPWGQAAQQQPQQPQPSRGMFGGLFGGGQPAPQQQQPQYQQPAYAPPPQQQYAPGYQPGMFQRSGSGFLGSALTTAAGVAGGMMAANALSGLFSGNHGSSQAASFGGGGNAGNFGQANSAGEAAPWATPPLGAPDPMDQGGEQKDYAQQASSQPDTGWQDAAASAQDSGWQDASNTDSGWSDSSGGSDVDNS
jgi:hypothetical protein